MDENNLTRKQLIEELRVLRKRAASLDTPSLKASPLAGDERESAETYRSLFENASDAIFLLDAGTQRIVECNEKASDITGYTRPQLKSMSARELHPPAEEAIVSRIFQKVTEQGSLSGISGISHLRSDESLIPVEINARMIELENRKYVLCVCRDITHRKEEESRLKESESRYRALFRNMLDAFAYHEVICDRNGDPVDYVFLEVNDAFERFTGLKRADVIGKRVTKVIPGFRTAKPDLISIYGNVALTGQGKTFDLFFKPLNRWYAVSAYCPKHGFFATTFEDITHRKQTEEELLRIRDEWERTFDSIPDVIAIMDNNYRIVHANITLARKLGMRREEIAGKFCYEVMHGLKKPPAHCPHHQAVKSGREQVQEIDDRHLNGHFLISMTPLRDAAGRSIGVVEVARDITEIRKLEKRLQELVITDELTGLLNRRGFFTLAEQQMKLAKRGKKTLSLLYFDVDNLKVINDALGHRIGDRALREAASVLRDSFRESDIVARVGGDEFAVLITDGPGGSVDDAVVSHVQKKVEQRNRRKRSRLYRLSFSMGFHVYEPERPSTLDQLLSQADQRMYEQKAVQHGARSSEEPPRDRRVFERFPTDKEAATISVNGKVTAVVRNAGLGGVCLQARSRFRRDRPYSLTIASALGDITARGVVMWSATAREPLPRTEASSLIETGFRFLELSGGERRLLGKFITNLARTNP